MSTFLPFIIRMAVHPPAPPTPVPANMGAPVNAPPPAPAAAPPVVTRTSRLPDDLAFRSPSSLTGLSPLTSVARNGILLPFAKMTLLKDNPNSPDLRPHLALLTLATK